MKPALPKRKHRPPVTRRSLRRAVFARDKGVCSNCGRDTVAIDKAVRLLAEAGYDFAPRVQFGRRWEAHHVRPLAEGGADDIDNLVTLCGLCHAPETAALRARFARERPKKPRHPIPQRPDPWPPKGSRTMRRKKTPP